MPSDPSTALQSSAAYRCPHCGESVWVPVDPSAGSRQRYTEDCQVCCRPAVLDVAFDGAGRAAVRARAE